MKITFLLLVLGYFTWQPGYSKTQPNTFSKAELKSEKDSLKKRNFRIGLPFADSFRVDSLREIIEGRFQIHTPSIKRGKIVDPFDPFIRENFIRKGVGKFWFFIVTLAIIGLMLYFRNAFPSQLELRFKSLFNGYHFRELISDFGISFTSGSVIAGGIATLIQAQAVVLIVVYSGYYSLNSTLFYLLVVLGLVAWRAIMFFLQSIEGYVLELSNLARSQTQRQLNVDLAISLLMFPFLVFAYFNSSLLHGINVSLIIASAITAGIALRIIIEFLGLFQESSFSLSGILYFCAFEILPHAIILTALFRRYST